MTDGEKEYVESMSYFCSHCYSAFGARKECPRCGKTKVIGIKRDLIREAIKRR